ncbi:unnamed protein product [Closterium sp. NIES-54]
MAVSLARLCHVNCLTSRVPLTLKSPTLPSRPALTLKAASPVVSIPTLILLLALALAAIPAAANSAAANPDRARILERSGQISSAGKRAIRLAQEAAAAEAEGGTGGADITGDGHRAGYDWRRATAGGDRSGGGRTGAWAAFLVWGFAFVAAGLLVAVGIFCVSAGRRKGKESLRAFFQSCPWAFFPQPHSVPFLLFHSLYSRISLPLSPFPPQLVTLSDLQHDYINPHDSAASHRTPRDQISAPGLSLLKSPRPLLHPPSPTHHLPPPAGNPIGPPARLHQPTRQCGVHQPLPAAGHARTRCSRAAAAALPALPARPCSLCPQRATAALPRAMVGRCCAVVWGAVDFLCWCCVVAAQKQTCCGLMGWSVGGLVGWWVHGSVACNGAFSS